jgi:hypothetical protein
MPRFAVPARRRSSPRITSPGPQRLVARVLGWQSSPRGTGIRGIQAYVILPVFTLRSAHGD